MIAHLKTSFSSSGTTSGAGTGPARPPQKVRRTVITRIHEAVKAIALCHNVTPVYEDTEEGEETEADQQGQQEVSYQASSPDEVGHI